MFSFFRNLFSYKKRTVVKPLILPDIIEEPVIEQKEEEKMITLQLLEEIFPNTKDTILKKFVDPLNVVCNKYEIVSNQRLACFLAQVGHESGGFRYTAENLNYSDSALLAIFKKYFKNEMDAAQYARKPEMIANRIYANRMGNGTENSGDGWKYRGRGLIQITGKNNYTMIADSLGKSIDETIDYLTTDEGAAMSAGWYWDEHKLNAIADKGNMKLLTRRINGGYNGLQDRLALYEHACSVLGG